MANFAETAHGKLPCIDYSTKFLLLRYQSESDAIDARENLWSIASISSSEDYCTKCGNYHLYDLYGLGLTSTKRLDVRVSFEREPISRYVRREICPECVSSDGRPKTVFTDLIDAQDAIDSLNINLDSPQWAYECPIGKGVHLTTKAASRNSDKQLGKISQKYLSKTNYEITEVPSRKNAQARTTLNQAKILRAETLAGKLAIKLKTEQKAIEAEKAKELAIKLRTEQEARDAEQAAKSIAWWRRKWGAE